MKMNHFSYKMKGKHYILYELEYFLNNAPASIPNKPIMKKFIDSRKMNTHLRKESHWTNSDVDQTVHCSCGAFMSNMHCNQCDANSGALVGHEHICPNCDSRIVNCMFCAEYNANLEGNTGQWNTGNGRIDNDLISIMQMWEEIYWDDLLNAFKYPQLRQEDRLDVINELFKPTRILSCNGIPLDISKIKNIFSRFTSADKAYALLMAIHFGGMTPKILDQLDNQLNANNNPGRLWLTALQKHGFPKTFHQSEKLFKKKEKYYIMSGMKGTEYEHSLFPSYYHNVRSGYSNKDDFLELLRSCNGDPK